MLSNKAYDILKYIALIGLPAITTCVVAILTALGFGENIVSTIAIIGSAVSTCIGTLIGVSSYQYNKGEN